MAEIRRRTTLRTSARSSVVPLPVERVWAVVASGEDREQWYVDAAPWIVRGALDRLTGGEARRWPPPGTPELRVGDTAGFWRVEEVAPPGRLALVADVRAPGTVTLAVTLTAVAAETTRITSEVRFDPGGPLGVAYLLTDLPAREVVQELCQRRLLRALRDGSRPGR